MYLSVTRNRGAAIQFTSPRALLTTWTKVQLGSLAFNCVSPWVVSSERGGERVTSIGETELCCWSQGIIYL